MSEVVVIVSAIANCITITIFYLYLLHAIRKLTLNFGIGPIYDRSQKLVLIASLSNYFEILTNVVCGLMLEFNNQKITLSILALICGHIFFTRFYAGSMALRAYRISVLHNYRAGNKPIAKISELSIYKKNILMVTVYSTITTIPGIILYLVDNDENVFNIYFIISYSIESAFFILSYIFILKTTIHPSILVEHFFYTLFWSSGTFSNSNTFEDRFLYIIPIRNLCLLYISYISLKVHCNLIRPPLPYDPIFSQIFEIKELYESFLLFLKNNSSGQIIDACVLCHELAKCKFCNNFDLFYKCLQSTSFYTEYSECIKECGIECIQDNLERFLIESKTQYLLSAEYLHLKRKYFVIYN